MQLDYFPATARFVLTVNRGEYNPREIMKEHGLDFSNPLSTPERAALFTAEPYAAVAFWEHATPAAREQLAALQHAIELSWARETGAHIKCPADQELWPFQKAGVEYALNRTNTLIGDQPGLGKTAQAICFANEVNAKRVLVVCPANVRLQWARQVRRWSTMPYPYTVYPILSGRHGVHPSAQWNIVSYDLARSPAIWRALAKGTYDVLIIDEGHFLKTIDTHRTRAVFGGGRNPIADPLAQRSGAVLCLTGTPLPNRPREAYTLARGLCFDAIDFMSEDDFRYRFNPSKRVITTDPATLQTKVYVEEHAGRHGELQARLRSNMMVRRLKRGPMGVMQQLKEPRIDLVHIEADAAINHALQAERLLDFDFDPDDWEGMDAETMGSIATARRLMGEAMAPHGAGYVEMCLQGGEEKIVVFGHHIKALDIIERKLAKYGLVRIDGSVSAARKLKLVDEFRTNPNKRVCLGNTLSMGTGTDGLQDAAYHLVMVEPDWVHGNNEQAIDRLDRGGQEGHVQADLLVTPGSLAEKILGKAIIKGRTVEMALDRRI